MSFKDILEEGARFANADEAAREVLADFNDHAIGIIAGEEQITVTISGGAVAVAGGLTGCCDGITNLSPDDLCCAIDGSLDLMEFRKRGEVVAGDTHDSSLSIHFMGLFPFFDAMVRLYGRDPLFRKRVSEKKASLG